MGIPGGPVAKVKVEMVVPDAAPDEVIQTVVASARTGKIGDGKVFIYDVAESHPHPQRRPGRRAL